MRRQWRILTIIAILAVVAAFILGFKTTKIGNFERGVANTPMGLQLGLDLQGGIDLVYQANLRDPVTDTLVIPTQDEMQATKKTIERRVNASGLGEPNIQILGDNRLLIQLPGVSDSARAKTLIGETAQLEIKRRLLNVARDIEEISQEDILGVRVSSLAIEIPEEIEVGTTTSATSTPVTSTESVTGDEPAQEKPPVPVLVIDFTEIGASEFETVLAGMLESLLPIPGTGDVFPNLLTISAEGESSPMSPMPYHPLFVAPGGQTVPLTTFNLFERLGGGNSFLVNLQGQLDDLAAAEDRFGNDPKITFTEVLGKMDEDLGLTGKDLDNAYPGQHAQTGLPVINLEFNPDGTKKFAELTTQIAGTADLSVFVLDDVELMSVGAQRPITGGAAFIEGRGFTFEYVRDTSLLLESGRLDIPIELIQERTVDAILGADSLARSALAGMVGLALVLLFMILYYRVAGIVAALALIIYGAILLAIFKVVPVTLTLSGVAAAILSIGMAVDANILIFERMKEELRAGRTILSSINIGFNRAWPAIRDSNISTLITCGILFWFADTLGATIVQGFAITLAIGVGLSMFSAIIVSRSFLRLVAVTPIARRISLFVPSGAADMPQKSTGTETV